MRLFSRLQIIWHPLRRHPRWTATGAIACVLIGLGVSYFAERRPRASRHLRQGEQAIQERDFATAQSDLKEHLALRPESGEGHFLLAQACRRSRSEDFDRAQAHLGQASRLMWPEKACATELSLLDFQSSGLPDQLELRLRQLPADGEIDGRLVLEALVRGCIRADRLEDAVAYADQWIAYVPDDWYAFFCRGTLHQHLDDSVRAVRDYERVLQLRPGNADVEYRLGLALV